MLAACRARDFTSIFRLVKLQAGIYPSMIGRLCDLTPSRVGEVMSGRRQLVHMDVIERVADGLRIPGHLLGLARRSWESTTILAVAERDTHQVAGPASDNSPALPGADVDGLLAITSRVTPSPSMVKALLSAIEDYWRQDDQHGGEALRPAVVGQLRYVIGLLKDQPSNPFKRDLHMVAAELARLTGWTYFDARKYSQARAYFVEALQLAKAIDGRQTMANVLACMSLQATYQGKPADSLALVNAAQDEFSDTARTTPRVLSMLSMREAFAHASLGSKTAAHMAIAEAHQQFEQVQVSDPDPAWVTYFDETKLVVDTGIAHSRLGDVRTAEGLIEKALQREKDTNQRGRAFHAFWLARTQLQLGKLELACHTATEALKPASAVASERVASHLREFYEQLAPFREEPAAVAFEARLREALPA
jgi:tetratricopeptide (TPR) repeat protein